MAFMTRRTMLSSTAVALVLPGLSVPLPAQAQTMPNKAAADTAPDTDWRNYAADLASTRYAPLDQINAGNFDHLEVAWRFPSVMLGSRPEYTWEATPLVIKGRLYTTAGARRDVVCLDAATGARAMRRVNIPAAAFPTGATARRSAFCMSRRAISWWPWMPRPVLLWRDLATMAWSISS